MLAAWKTLVHDDRVAKCDATVRQTPHIFSDSPRIWDIRQRKEKKIHKSCCTERGVGTHDNCRKDLREESEMKIDDNVTIHGRRIRNEKKAMLHAARDRRE